MTTAKQKAARPGRVKAASTTTSDSDHTSQKRIFVVEKDAFSEIRIELTDFFGKVYCDLRIFDNHAGTRVPTKKGVTIPITMLPALIDGLTKAQAATPQALNEAQSGTAQA
jgi:hypothetical protein